MTRVDYHGSFYHLDQATVSPCSHGDPIPIMVGGSKRYIVDRIGEFQEAGIAEIIFGGIPSGDIDRLQQFEAEILAAF